MKIYGNKKHLQKLMGGRYGELVVVIEMHGLVWNISFVKPLVRTKTLNTSPIFPSSNTIIKCTSTLTLS